MTDQYFADDLSGLLTRDQLLSMSGLEFMHAMKAGKIPMPPIARIMGMRVDLVEPHRVIFNGMPAFDHLNPMATLHGGWYGTILDSAMSCAAMTVVPQGSVYTTLEYKVNITRGLSMGQRVTCEGRIQHAGRSTVVANGEIRGAEDGKLYATGTATCIIMALDTPDQRS